MSVNELQIPDVNNYSRFRPFFEDFFQLNKSANKSFTFRYLAKELGWSASYLNEVLQGRRSLSLNKILEFIDFLGLRGVRAERLIFLALFEANGVTKRTKEFVSAQNSQDHFQTTTNDEVKVFLSIIAYRIMDYLIWRNGEWDAKDFSARCRKMDRPDASAIKSALKWLEEKEFIIWDSSKKRYEIPKHEFFLDYMKLPSEAIASIEKEYCYRYINFLDEPFGRWSLATATAILPDDRLRELFDRFNSLRNFINELDRESRAEMAKSSTPKKTFNLYQYSLNMFRIFRSDDDLKKEQMR